MAIALDSTMLTSILIFALQASASQSSELYSHQEQQAIQLAEELVNMGEIITQRTDSYTYYFPNVLFQGHPITIVEHSGELRLGGASSQLPFHCTFASLDGESSHLCLNKSGDFASKSRQFPTEILQALRAAQAKRLSALYDPCEELAEAPLMERVLGSVVYDECTPDSTVSQISAFVKRLSAHQASPSAAGAGYFPAH